jgi:hypothetical protein
MLTGSVAPHPHQEAVITNEDHFLYVESETEFLCFNLLYLFCDLMIIETEFLKFFSDVFKFFAVRLYFKSSFRHIDQLSQK